MPENTVCVTRGTKWGNPFRVGGYFALYGQHGKFELYPDAVGKPGYEDWVFIKDNAMAVEAFENYLKTIITAKNWLLRPKKN